MRIRKIALSLAVILYGSLSIAQAQTASAPAKDDARLSVLPPALRPQGLALLNQTDDVQRAELADKLAKRQPAESMDFLLAVLEADSSDKVRAAILDRLGKHPHPQVREALMRHAVSDPVASVSIVAIERMRINHAQDLALVLGQRLEKARQTGDEAALRLLGQEQERWISLVRGTMLPAFLRVPPPAFSLKAADQAVRVLAFGDFGDGSDQQKQTAAAMLRYHRQTPFDFAITVGDNFYGDGMESLTDPRWKTWWGELYDPLGLKIYATLGNHDWGLADSPAAEILYTQRSQSWRMPAPYYIFSAGPVQFFALDTNEVSEAQFIWLKNELEKSQARWKVVYGHHPIYSAGENGDTERLIKRLLPILKGRADVYITGHDHDFQHLKPEGGVHFFVAGGGGADIRPTKQHPLSLFAKTAYGFAVLEADSKQFKVKFVDSSLNPLYEFALNKSGSSSAASSGQ